MRSALAALCFIVAACVVPMTISPTTGCTAPQQRVSVNTLYTTHVTVDAAFTSYMVLVLKGQLTTNNVPQVADAYRDFQEAFNVAVSLVQGNTNAPVSPAVTAAATKVLSLTAH